MFWQLFLFPSFVVTVMSSETGNRVIYNIGDESESELILSYDSGVNQHTSLCGLYTNKYMKVRDKTHGQDRMEYGPEFLGHNTAYLAVYDGHGSKGALVSEYLWQNLFSNIKTHPQILTETPKALFESFQKTNEGLNENPYSENSGSTATVSLVLGNKVFTAWTGDSEAKIFRKPESTTPVIMLTTNLHNFDDPSEVSRVEKAGGQVFGKRLQGELIISRSFGDTCYGKSMICDPYISEYTLTSSDAYIIVGSDGYWDEIPDIETSSVFFKGDNSKRDRLLNIDKKIKYHHLVYTNDMATALVAMVPKGQESLLYVGDDVSVVCARFNNAPELDKEYGLEQMIAQGIDLVMKKNVLDMDIAEDYEFSKKDVEESIRKVLTPDNWLEKLAYDKDSMPEINDKQVLTKHEHNKYFSLLESVIEELRAGQHKKRKIEEF